MVNGTRRSSTDFVECGNRLPTSCPPLDSQEKLAEPTAAWDSAGLVVQPATGGTRAVIEALIAAGPAGVLGLVIETIGSTYTMLGTVIGISPVQGRVGWISGGCLESALEDEARDLQDAGHAGVTEFDTRNDNDLMFGTRIGCRGLVRIALLPLALLPGIESILRKWACDAADITVSFSATGQVHMAAGDRQLCWDLPWRAPPAPARQLQVRIPRAPQLLVFGAGPEAAVLLPWMRRLGWYVGLIERRTRWIPQLALADLGKAMMPAPAVIALSPLSYDAAIVMNHDFELDREALECLVSTGIQWIGLLGPAERCDDLLRLLGAPLADALRSRLHAPVGLPLGGHGPEAISLAIAAELHGRWNRAEAPPQRAERHR